MERFFRFLLWKHATRHLNLFWTIVFNFALCSFKDALHFPILCYGRFNVRQLSGRVVFSVPLKKGLLSFGKDKTNYRYVRTTSISISPGSIIKVGSASFFQGTTLVMGKDSLLILGKNVTVGDRAEIICMDKIQVGDHSDITWDCQVTDFGSHPIKDLLSGMVGPLKKPVHIGSYCWICNRTSIMPGTIIPNHTIVSFNSLLNKDYVSLGIKEFSLLGGIPAKLLKDQVSRDDYSL